MNVSEGVSESVRLQSGVVQMRKIVMVFAALAAVAGCGAKEEPRPPRTAEEQRKVDSTVGASALPGAGGVRGALAAQDSAKAKQAQLDSIAKNPQ